VIMRALWPIACFVLFVNSAISQTNVMQARHDRIKAMNRKGDYAQAIKELEAQVRSATAPPWNDSLWKYVYPLGHAHWKVHGASAGAKAAEDLCRHIHAIGSAPTFEINALIKLSALYYDLSMMQEYERVSARALALAERNKADIPPLLLGDALYTMALVHQDMGRPAQALPLFVKAVEVARGMKSDPLFRTASYCNALGSIYNTLGRIRDAERTFEEGIAATEKDISMHALSSKVALLGNWAIAVQGTGDLPRCKELYFESLRTVDRMMAVAADDPQAMLSARLDRTALHLNLSTVYFSMADFQRARQYLDLTLRERQELLGNDHVKVIELNEAMAEIEAMSGNYTGAEELLREQIDMVAANMGRESEQYVKLHSDLARMVLKQGRMGEADSLYAVMIPTERSVLTSSSNMDLADALAERADLRIQESRYTEAFDDLLLSRSIRARILGPHHVYLAEADVALSGAALAMGDTSRARQFADTAIALLADRIAICERPYAPTSLRNPGLLADALHAQVSAWRATTTRPGEPRTWLDRIELAVSSLHRNKASISDDASRLQLVASQKKLFDLGSDIAFLAWERHKTTEDLQRFLDLAESDRSIVLKGRLNAFTSLGVAGVPEQVLVRERQLVSAMGTDVEDESANDLQETERAYAAFLDTLRERYPEYFVLRHGEPHITIDDMRQRLVTSDRDLLAYTVTAEHLYMLVVTADTVALWRTSSKDLHSAVEALHQAVITRKDDAYFNAAHTLYTMVFAPVEALLHGPELLIIADGELQRVNFETLLTRPSNAKNFRDHLLIQRHSIAYLLSATTAVQFAGLRSGRPSKALALAPGFTDELKQEYIAGVHDPARIDHDFLSYVRQPFAMNTAMELGDVLPTRLMLGGEANEKDFRALAKDHGILHLGTHAELNESSPMYSRLVLSKDGTSMEADADGYLHAYEIYELDLRAQLAVLTACGTGVGDNTEGEGVRSLGYSFAYAGCPSLVTSLWEIDEKVSSEIITRFYGYLADGLPKHMALRKAKLDHLGAATGELALPYYWGGMVLVGDVEPLEVGTFWTRHALWVAGLLVLLVLIGMWWKRKRR